MRDPDRPAAVRGAAASEKQWASAGDRQTIEATLAALELVSSKWKVDVIVLLASGVRRHGRLHDHLVVSKKVLTETLRGLAEVPARVEYTLTPLGWSFTAPLLALCEWAEEHAPEVGESRERYDGVLPGGGTQSPRFSAAFRIRSGSSS
jgi:DNA-binding HxlR family transcriptional regulator